jgi:type IV secretory pathway VirB10-like protein
MRFAGFNTVLAVILYGGFAVAACDTRQQEQNQPPAQPPATTQPQNEPAQPSQAQPEQTAPAEAPAQTPPSQGTQAPQAQTPQMPSKEATPPSARLKSTRKKKRPLARSHSATQSGKVVVRNGGASERPPQLSPALNDEQTQHQRENTKQLLTTTDANLKKVSGKQLTAAQQSLLDQINTYVRQSKAASESGDVSRAHTLAFKAHLLSDELARK